MRKVLVTGDRGLVGRAVVAALHAHGAETVGYDRADGHDILDAAAMRRAAEGCDGIAHLAASLARPPDTSDIIITANVTGTWNALEAARHAGIKRVVAISSVNALGMFMGNGLPDYLPFDDDHPARPSSPYGISKRLGEEMCRCFTLKHGISTVCLRPPSVWDAAKRSQVLNARAADPKAEWTPYWEYGAYVDVRDLAEAVWCGLTCPDPGHVAALVCADDAQGSVPPRDLAKRLLPQIPWRGPDEPDPWRALVRSDRAKQVLGWQPKYNWRDG